MTFARIAALVGCGLGVMVANVAVTVLYMVVYGHVIDRGHEKAYYDAHVQAAAPYLSIIAGIPLMFFAGRWAGAVPSALIVWATYAVIDLVIVVASGVTFRMGVLVAISLLTKLAFLLSAPFGFAPLWMAVLADTGATVVVTLNGLRLLGVKSRLRN